MNLSVSERVRQQKVGGLAALYLAAAYVVAMPFYLVFVKYQSAADTAERVAVLAGNQNSMRAMNLIAYVIFGIVLAVLALALYSRLRDGATTKTEIAIPGKLV